MSFALLNKYFKIAKKMHFHIVSMTNCYRNLGNIFFLLDKLNTTKILQLETLVQQKTKTTKNNRKTGIQQFVLPEKAYR